MTTTQLRMLAAAAALLLPRTAAAQQPGAAGQGEVVPIREWLVAGTFPTDTGATRLGRAYLPAEGALTPAEGEPAGTGAWRHATADSLGRINLNPLFAGAQRDNAAAYALTYLWSPADRTVMLAVESDDDVLVWLNGVLVHRNEVARGVGNGVDTLVLRLARGYNRVLYKVLNRSGGFGLGARLLGAPGQPVADLRATTGRPAAPDLATRPAPTVTLGPVRVGDGALLSASPAGSPLLVPVQVGVARWGGVAGPITVTVGSRAVTVPPASEGETHTATIMVAWSELAAAAAQGGATVEARPGAAAQPTPGPARPARPGRAPRTAAAPTPPLASVPLRTAADGLLALLSRPIQAAGWQGSRSDPAASGTPGGAPWYPVDETPDSAGRAATGALALIGRVPGALAGLTLELDLAEFLPEARVTVNGVVAAPDSMGRVLVCAACALDAPLQVVIGPGGAHWWDLPRLRVRDAGWLELRECMRWAAELAGPGDGAAPAPAASLDPALAETLLKAALLPDKKQYHALVQAGLARLAPVADRIRRDTLRLTGNSHIDAAWLWRWPETVDVVRNTWRSAAKLMRKYPEMKYAASSARYYAWLEQYEPALLRSIQALVKQGRWELVGGWWVEPDANIPSGESLVRQGLYGQRTFQRLFGRTATVGWIPDTFGYPWTLPQILEKSGMTSFVTQKLHWNDMDDWPAALEQFWWEGPDGSRVLAYIPFGYDADLTPEPLARQWQATRDSSALPLLLTLYGVGDHGGGPTAQMLDRRRALERVPAYPALRDQLPGDALKQAATRLSKLPPAAAPYPGGGPQPARGSAPVLRDELYFEYHRGVYTTQAAIKADNRRMEALLGAAEAAAVAASAGGTGFAYPAAELTAAWEKTLFNQFHDLLAGTGIREIYQDADVDYRAADSLANGVLARALTALGTRLDTRPPAPGLRPFLVFNPAARPRGGRVRLPMGPGSESVGAVDAVGRRLPSARAGDTLEVQVDAVPAMGAAVVFAGPGSAVTRAARRPAARTAAATRRAPSRGDPADLRAAVRGARVLENAYIRAEVDPRTGELARLFDKRLAREMLRPGGNALVMFEDKPKDWDAWNIDDLNGRRTPLDQDVRVGEVRRNALGDEVVVERSAPGAKVRQTLRLPTARARLEVETEVEWNAAHQLLKAVFPLAFRADSSWAEIPYGAISRPTRPVTRRDTARFELPMQRWVEATAAPGQDSTGARVTWGVALVNDAKYGYDAHGDTLRLTLLRSPKSPDAQADMGTHHFRYAIVPHTGDFRSQLLESAAVELNEPLRVLPLDPHEGSGAALPGPVSAVGAGVVVGAVKRAEEGGAAAAPPIVVRLVENHGRATTATIKVAGAGTLLETDLLERPSGPRYAGENGIFRVPLKAWEIKTLKAAP